MDGCNEQMNTEEALERGGLIPAYGGPRFGGGELRKNTLDLVGERRVLVDTLPVILLDFEVLAELVAEINTESVADENIKDPLIPPALSEVGKHVDEEHLKNLPGD